MSYELIRKQKQYEGRRGEWELQVRAMALLIGWQLWLEHTGMGACLMPQCLIDMRNVRQDISESKRLF